VRCVSLYGKWVSSLSHRVLGLTHRVVYRGSNIISTSRATLTA
jgi:hypothetical protein